MSKQAIIPKGVYESLSYEFHSLESYAEFSMSILTKSAEDFNKRIDHIRSTNTFENAEMLVDDLSHEQRHLEDVYPKYQWNAQFIAAYSEFEVALNRLCNEFKGARGLELSFKDLSGAGIERAKNYISKVVGAGICFSGVHWQTISLCGEIRNALIHNNGIIKYSPDESKSLSAKINNSLIASQRECLPGYGEAVIVLDKTDVLSSIAAYKNLLSSLCKHENESGLK
jgi:hypothetical protein